MTQDPIYQFYRELQTRLAAKSYTKLDPIAPLDLAFMKHDWAGGNYVVAVVDMRESDETPAEIFERVKHWFRTAIGRREHGVLLFVYSPALASTVEEIKKSTFWADSVAVFPGAYDLSTNSHWLTARGLEYEIFG